MKPPESKEIDQFIIALFVVMETHSTGEVGAILCAAISAAANSTTHPNEFKRMVCHVVTQSMDKVEVAV